MSKQYIKSSNQAPSMMLNFAWLLALTTKVLDWPTWLYGVAGTFVARSAIVFVIRIATEDGVDVVKR